MDQFIPYGRQSISQDDIEQVLETLNSEFLTQGPKVSIFEKAISEYVSCNYSIAVNSATSALHIACLALDLKKGDILWTSPITFVASANCALYCGASVDFIDIDINTGLISIEKLVEKLENAKKHNKLPKILIPVHLAGVSCDMENISKLASKYDIRIIEDASHAIGGKYKEARVGSCKYSDITIFSFHPVKIITTGEGGMATTNSLKLAERLFSLRSHGITRDKNKFILESAPPWHYEQQELGFNYRMNDIQASLGISQIEKVNEFIGRRYELYFSYKKLINSDRITYLEIPDETFSSLHLMVIRLKDISEKQHRNIFLNLRANGIGVQLHYIPVHLQPYYKRLGFKVGDYQQAEKYASSALSLPLYPNLKLEDLEYVVRNLIESIDKYYD